MFVAFLSLACVAPPDTAAKESGDTDHTIDSTDTALEVDGVTVTTTAKETVFRVSWETEAAADALVQCGTEGEFDRDTTGTSSDGGLRHDVLLLLAEGSAWSCRAVSTLASGQWISDTFVIETPFAPADMPGLTLSAGSSEGLHGLLLVANSLEGSSWVSIVNRDGRRVWWDQGEESELISEVWMSTDGASLVWNSMDIKERLHVVSLDGSSREIFELPDFHHGFVPLPDGGYAALRYKFTEVAGTTIKGDEIVEIDAAGQEQRVVWNVFESFSIMPEEVPPDVSEYDFSHANSIMYYPAEDLYLVSFYGLSTVVAINRTSGDLAWRVGDRMSDFSFIGSPTDRFARQHSPRLTDAGILVFNNRDVANAEASDRWSEAAEYSLDTSNHTYQKLWSFNADKEIYVPVMGNADRQADGTTLVGWGSGGRAVQVDDKGEVLWQLDSDLGGPFGYVHLVDEVAGSTR